MVHLHSLAARKEQEKRVKLPVSIPNGLLKAYSALAEKSGYRVTDLTEEALLDYLKKVGCPYSPTETGVES